MLFEFFLLSTSRASSCSLSPPVPPRSRPRETTQELITQARTTNSEETTRKRAEMAGEGDLATKAATNSSTSTSTTTTHRGSCHCGAVRFEVDAPRVLRAVECNCAFFFSGLGGDGDKRRGEGKALVFALYSFPPRALLLFLFFFLIPSRFASFASFRRHPPPPSAPPPPLPPPLQSQQAPSAPSRATRTSSSPNRTSACCRERTR